MADGHRKPGDKLTQCLLAIEVQQHDGFTSSAAASGPSSRSAAAAACACASSCLCRPLPTADGAAVIARPRGASGRRATRQHQHARRACHYGPSVDNAFAQCSVQGSWLSTLPRTPAVRDGVQRVLLLPSRNCPCWAWPMYVTNSELKQVVWGTRGYVMCRDATC